MVRAGLVAAAAGPAAFIAAWAALGAKLEGYSPVEDAISRLAATGAPTQPAMTAGLLALGTGLLSFAATARSQIGPKAAAAAGVSAVATFGVAALPLGAPSRDVAHGVAASIGYASLALTPLLAKKPFPRALSVATGAVVAASLLATTLDVNSGFFQRTGLATGHAWVVAAALALLRTRSADARSRGRGASGDGRGRDAGRFS